VNMNRYLRVSIFFLVMQISWVHETSVYHRKVSVGKISPGISPFSSFLIWSWPFFAEDNDAMIEWTVTLSFHHFLKRLNLPWCLKKITSLFFFLLHKSRRVCLL
jgi:hypothetical protein